MVGCRAESLRGASDFVLTFYCLLSCNLKNSVNFLSFHTGLRTCGSVSFDQHRLFWVPARCLEGQDRGFESPRALRSYGKFLSMIS